jgi:hypothetical protein
MWACCVEPSSSEGLQDNEKEEWMLEKEEF